MCNKITIPIVLNLLLKICLPSKIVGRYVMDLATQIEMLPVPMSSRTRTQMSLKNCSLIFVDFCSDVVMKDMATITKYPGYDYFN